MRGSLHQDVVVLGIQRVEHAVDVPDRHHRAVHHDPVRRLRRKAKSIHLNQIQRLFRESMAETKSHTLHRSSRVLRGVPSSAVLRASTGFDLPPPRRDAHRWVTLQPSKSKRSRKEKTNRGRLLLEEGLDLAGLLLDAGDDGLEVLVGVEVGRRRRSHLAGRRRGGRFCVWVCVGPGRWSRLLSLKLRVLCSWG